MRLQPHLFDMPIESKDFSMYQNLPHISEKFLYQFVTFRTQASTDEYVRTCLQAQNVTTKRVQYELDAYLDRSQKGAYFYDEILDMTHKYLLDLNPQLCEMVAFSIMPNHLHLLFVQHDDLAKIIRYIKGGLSYRINNKIGKRGEFWQRNYFDKAVRDATHFDVVYRYIKHNAIKANLEDSEKRFYGIYE